MYILQIDQDKMFECHLKVQGTSLNKSKISLVVENGDMDMRFRGNVSEHGKVSIPIKNLKSMLTEGIRGQIYLEVIADNTYFVPFKSEYITEIARKVTLNESVQLTNTTPTVELFSPKKHAVKLVKSMIKENISLFDENRYDDAMKLIAEYMVDNHITDKHQSGEIVNYLLEKAVRLMSKKVS